MRLISSYSDSSDEEFITTSTAGVWQFIDVTSS